MCIIHVETKIIIACVVNKGKVVLGGGKD